jgi:hypothetical protein
MRAALVLVALLTIEPLAMAQARTGRTLDIDEVSDAGHDRSLVFTDWTHPTPDDRALVYQTGAYVLHLLRETLGETLFWTGVRDYTRRYAGRSVTTVEFQRAFERSIRQDLSAFFNTWVYRGESP